MCLTLLNANYGGYFRLSRLGCLTVLCPLFLIQGVMIHSVKKLVFQPLFHLGMARWDSLANENLSGNFGKVLALMM